MAITKPKPKPTVDDFIGRAPDAGTVVDKPASAPPEGGKKLKARRGTTRSQVSVVLADEMVNRLDVQATKKYMSRSAYITMALNEYLERAEQGS